MEVYLVAGGSCEKLKQIIEKDGDIHVVRCARTINDLLKQLKNESHRFDIILLIDQAIDLNAEEFGSCAGVIKGILDSLYPDAELRFITKEPLYHQVYKQAAGDNRRFKAYFVDTIRVPVSFFSEVCLEEKEKCADSYFLQTGEHQSVEKKKFWQVFKRNRKQQEASDSPSILEEKLLNSNYLKKNYQADVISVVPKGLNRVVALTGHRGSGVTSTAANLALAASMHGLKTIVLDLDIEYRGINLYFSKFGDEVDLNPDLASSLVKCLLKPDSFEINSCRINENLNVATLAYSIDSRDKLLDFIGIKRLLSLVTALKPKFNLVLLDIPFHVLKEYSELLIHLDSIGMCVNNSLYSIINTAKNIGDYLEGENLTAFRMKLKAVITKFNEGNRHQGRKLSEELTCGILGEISTALDSEVLCAGIIPYSKDFDHQVDSGKKLCTVSNEFKRYYLNVLNNLM